MNTFKPGWCVAYTRPQHEKKVAGLLSITGIEFFLPMVKTLRQWSDRRKYLQVPLFPSYIFIRLNEANTYFNSLELPGLLYYLRSGKEVAPVSESTIISLKQLITSGCSDISVSSDRFTAGENVLITHGPFTGFNGEIIRHNGKRKLLIRMDLLQRNVLADIPVEYISTHTRRVPA